MRDNVAIGIIIVILFACLLILFCFLLIKLHINKVKNYTKLIYQKDIDFQKELTSSIVETQEQVLNNISQDLHDDAGQQLTFINFLIENYKLDHPELEELLIPLSQSAHNLSDSIRGISHSLNNQLLLQQDLLKAIETESNRINKSGVIHINYQCSGDKSKEFSTNEKIVIYRIFQEIINNCLKHAEASEIKINVATEPTFTLSISDNGKGFDYSNIKNSSNSLGLHSITNRAGIIGYEIDIHSIPEKGTTITLTKNQLT